VARKERFNKVIMSEKLGGLQPETKKIMRELLKTNSFYQIVKARVFLELRRLTKPVAQELKSGLDN